MIEDFVLKHKLAQFRISQFNEQFYTQAIDSFDELTTWPQTLREELKKEVEFSTLILDREFVSKDGSTIKVLFKRKVDNQRIEAVLMKHNDGRNTVCVSCMVGCPVNCKFCATGKMGFGGNLSDREIVDQVLYFQRYLKSSLERVTNVVFMGMGEPLLNLDNVLKAIEVFTNPKKLAMSTRRITISTSGYIPQLKTLIENGFRGRIAVSLHASNQELRAKLMPVAKIFKLSELMQLLDDYVSLTNKRISYEYILIQDVNDSKENALELVDLLSNRLAHVNLIPFNTIREEDFQKPSKAAIYKFADILRQNGIHTTIRVTMGEDVNAACGQLADRENTKNIKKKLNI